MRRIHVLVSGRVQGVFYRATCADAARGLGLAGWVRNLPDGRVEGVFEGPDAAVGDMLVWCRRGPELARVDEVEVTDEVPTGEREFRVTR